MVPQKRFEAAVQSIADNQSEGGDTAQCSSSYLDEKNNENDLENSHADYGVSAELLAKEQGDKHVWGRGGAG